ncbi:CubicO group peptidase, beta-lactamase class C family [Glycomyces sambucus]|uniref:CubicO group peptidase, beta-lactamase class C family n=1 Tax=Glycomyces sambucus TaxID=380244 RepID=A0A1G9I708_9ACTN|nr:serine hydrolase domain-containing protein [Glycomyces sambucus]SDL21018.1 CubicO group peptidase, beta-lactamase class C family [Glycomyces sambucus]
MNASLAARLDRVAARFAAKPAVHSLSLAAAQPSTGFTWEFGEARRPYFIASITKLATVAMVMQLRDEGALTLDTRAADLIGEDVMRGLNVRDGRDLGPAVTVRELLTQTSGIPDYFEQRRPDGGTFLADVLREDGAWTFEDYLAMARSLPSRFAPSAPGRAHYCDTNYQLLGRIVETATAGGFERALRRRVLEPLALQDTWLFTPDTLDRYDEVAPVFHGRNAIRIPKAIASFAPDGALVSTAADQIRLLRAFLGGELFPAAYLAEMTAHWNPVFSRLEPIEYGMGVMRFALPRWQSPLAPAPAMIGHSGAFGSVLYHVPDLDLYLAGTVNQMRPRSLPYPLLLRLAGQFGRRAPVA